MRGLGWLRCWVPGTIGQRYLVACPSRAFFSAACAVHHVHSRNRISFSTLTCPRSRALQPSVTVAAKPAISGLAGASYIIRAKSSQSFPSTARQLHLASAYLPVCLNLPLHFRSYIILTYLVVLRSGSSRIAYFWRNLLHCTARRGAAISLLRGPERYVDAFPQLLAQ